MRTPFPLLEEGGCPQEHRGRRVFLFMRSIPNLLNFSIIGLSSLFLISTFTTTYMNTPCRQKHPPFFYVPKNGPPSSRRGKTSAFIQLPHF